MPDQRAESEVPPENPPPSSESSEAASTGGEGSSAPNERLSSPSGGEGISPTALALFLFAGLIIFIGITGRLDNVLLALQGKGKSPSPQPTSAGSQVSSTGSTASGAAALILGP